MRLTAIALALIVPKPAPNIWVRRWCVHDPEN